MEVRYIHYEPQRYTRRQVRLVKDGADVAKTISHAVVGTTWGRWLRRFICLCICVLVSHICSSVWNSAVYEGLYTLKCSTHILYSR